MPERDLDGQAQLILRSFQQVLGRSLLPSTAGKAGSEEVAALLFHAPFVVVSHDTSPDPLLTYANARALELWETDLKTLIGMPSRLTAEPVRREERARMLEEARVKGYIDDYRGIRISTSGRRFEIRNAIVWSLTDDQGHAAGQAATFSDWSWLQENS